MPRYDSASHKLLPLEALRGIAAAFVVCHHFALAFLPRVMGAQDSLDPQGILAGSPLFLIVNGYAMVIIFFVLSGYVLSAKGLGPDPLPVIANTAVKRWFRLAPLICVSVLISWGLYSAGLYHYQEAGALNTSYWLSAGAYGNLPEHYQPTLPEALNQGLIGTFLYGSKNLNTNIWMVIYEFHGSMMVLFLAIFLASKRRWCLAGVLPLLGFWCFVTEPRIFPFLFGFIGVLLRMQRLSWGKKSTLCVLVVGLYLCGYYYPQGWYAWCAIIPLGESLRRLTVLTAGAFLLVSVFVTDNMVSRRFCGPVSRLLGRISFPLYLVHGLMILSFASWAYSAMHGGNSGILAAAGALFLTVTPLVWIMTRFDVWWLSVLSCWHPFKLKTAA